jgi:hypothetical protein
VAPIIIISNERRLRVALAERKPFDIKHRQHHLEAYFAATFDLAFNPQAELSFDPIEISIATKTVEQLWYLS